MRQEKTGKVCLNFMVDPRCYLVYIYIIYYYVNSLQMLVQIDPGYLMLMITLMVN